MSLKNGQLTIGSVSHLEDIEILRELTEEPMDMLSTHFNLTKKQFKQFIRQNGFGSKDTFTRVTQ